MKKIFYWIAENGKIISCPVREVYLNDPREVHPDEILTEIYYKKSDIEARIEALETKVNTFLESKKAGKLKKQLQLSDIPQTQNINHLLKHD